MTKIKVFKPSCKYKPIKKLGEGAFGTVYKAKSSNKSNVAIKKLKAIESTDLMEIIALRHFQHPAIISILDILNNDNCLRQQELAFVMPFAMVLDDYFYIKEQWSSSVMKSVIYQMIQGLQIMHDNNLLHLDIKPDNLLVLRSWENPIIKYTDFGLSMFVCNPNETTYSLNLRMTSTYRAPDVVPVKKANGLYNFSAKSDIYSVGLTILSILFKTHEPFEILEEYEDANDYEFIKYKYSNEWKSKISDPELVEVISKMISINPKNRYSISELLTLPYFSTYTQVDPSIGKIILPEEKTPTTSYLNFHSLYHQVYEYDAIAMITYVRMMDLCYLLEPYVVQKSDTHITLNSHAGKLYVKIEKLMDSLRTFATLIANDIFDPIERKSNYIDLYILKTFKGSLYRPAITEISDNVDDVLALLDKSNNAQEYEKNRLQKLAGTTSGEKITQKIYMKF